MKQNKPQRKCKRQSRSKDNVSSLIEDYTFEVTDGPVPCPIVWKGNADV
jgi:hypothetical protein